MRLRAGDRFPVKTFKSVSGEAVPVPDRERYVHLQFRRYSGCPICTTHMGELLKSAGRIEAAGVKEVIFFHSPVADILEYQHGIPFTFVADPGKVYYREYGVESSLRFLSVTSLWAALRGMVQHKFRIWAPGGWIGLPAEFMIQPDGTVLAAHYGRHAYDQWSADQIIEIVRAAR